MKQATRLTQHVVVLCAVALSLSAAATAETTQCTPITLVPMTITSPGIYCLTEDLTTQLSAGDAITIEADDVTIDMNGHKLENLRTDWEGNDHGIRAYGRQRISIRNGTIRRYVVGIALTEGRGHLVEDVLLDENWWRAIALVGTSGSIVRHSQVIGTRYSDLFLERVSAATVAHNTIVSNADFSVRVEAAKGCVIRKNSIVWNGEGGAGILVNSSYTVSIGENRIARESQVADGWGIVIVGAGHGLIVDNWVDGALGHGIMCGGYTSRDNLVSGAVADPFAGCSEGS